MTKVFPYRQWQKMFLPLLPIRLKDVGIVYALADSGANISIFESKIGDDLGIILEQGKRIPLQGIGGRIIAYEHLLPMEVNGARFDCKVAFSREFHVSLNILGRDNFFHQFIITFDEVKRVTILDGRR
jgi:hypothetical protein